MKQPVHSFLLRHHWKNWSLLDWWQIPEKIREETRHTLGALDALLNYVKGAKPEDTRFTDKVVLAGGSVGAAFPVIISSFAPEKVDGLMVIYGFTNFQRVIQPLLFSQGLLHYKLTENSSDFSDNVKITSIRLLSKFFSFLLGNMVKYGEMEAYLPNISETPIHFINGTKDPLVPPEAYLPLWENSPEPKSETWVEGGHFNPGNPEDMLRTGKLMYAWADAQGLRSCNNVEK
jgi:pimeloyl-ACP methyl ester carboxylesterase